MRADGDDQDLLKPGDEILFSTQWFIDYPNGFYNPWHIKFGPIPKQGPAPGTVRTGIIAEGTDKAVLVKITSGGSQRGCKSWVPLARVIGKTGSHYSVPNADALEWADDDRAYQEEKEVR